MTESQPPSTGSALLARGGLDLRPEEGLGAGCAGGIQGTATRGRRRWWLPSEEGGAGDRHGEGFVSAGSRMTKGDEAAALVPEQGARRR
jgi:hypothetical protein